MRVVDPRLEIRDPVALGAAIRARRQSLRLRQVDLASQIGVSRATLIAIEAGKDTAQIGIVLTVCRDLGLRLHLDASAP